MATTTTLHRTPAAAFAAKFAAMTDAEFIDYAELFDGYDGPTCPHCDASFPHSMANNWCWCAGCDACEHARECVVRYDAELAAYTAESARRFPPAPKPPLAAPTDDFEPF